jgi:hypothetical protein
MHIDLPTDANGRPMRKFRVPFNTPYSALRPFLRSLAKGGTAAEVAAATGRNITNVRKWVAMLRKALPDDARAASPAPPCHHCGNTKGNRREGWHSGITWRCAACDRTYIDPVAYSCPVCGRHTGIRWVRPDRKGMPQRYCTACRRMYTPILLGDRRTPVERRKLTRKDSLLAKASGELLANLEAEMPLEDALRAAGLDPAPLRMPLPILDSERPKVIRED